MAAAALAAALWLLPAAAHARPITTKKAIWGPLTLNGRSAFNTYERLGAGIYEMSLNWRATAPERPARPGDPDDPAYHWPAEIDTAIADARRHGMRVMLQLIFAPAWANGGQPQNWAPNDPRDLARFAKAAARRYPAVRRWMIWGEPTRQPNFMPLTPATGAQPLTRRRARAPRRYARMLDASYGALKRVRRGNIVIGGNSYTTGDVSPLNWIRGMRLPNGRRPRMDLYGHNPFTLRRPDLAKSLFRPGQPDFSDLDTLTSWLDRYGYRDRRGRKLKLFLSEWLVPTDHPNREFNFYVLRSVQADWITAGLKIVRGSPRIAALGWYSLLDDPPAPDGLEVARGLMEADGTPKPGFYAFRDG
jgi:hypothetical protein